MLADRGEERAGHADGVGSFPVAADRGVQVGEVVLDDGAVDAAGAGDAVLIQEHREPGQGPQRPGPAGAGFQAGGQPPADPPFGQVFQLRLRDAGEVQDAPGAVSETVHLPCVALVLRSPASALGQVRDLRPEPGQLGDRLLLRPAGMVAPFLPGPVQQR